MDRLIEQLVADGLVKSREDATEVVVLWFGAFHKMSRVQVKTRILSDTIKTMKETLGTIHTASGMRQ